MSKELRPNKHLLDSNFYGYQLSLQPLAVHRQNIYGGVDHIEQSDDQYSFIHTKVFSLHNHIFPDYMQQNTIFLVNKQWQVLKISNNYEPKPLSDPEVVWTIPHLNQRQVGNFNCSMLFPEKGLAVVNDGCGYLYVLHRPDFGQWKPMLSYKIPGDVGSVLKSVRRDALSNLHCVLMTLEMVSSGEEISHPTSTKPKPASVNTILQWITFDQSNENVWTEISVKKIEGHGFVDYVALESSCQALYVVSDAKFSFTADSANPLPPTPQDEMDVEGGKVKYTWIQTEEDITITVPVAVEVTKAGVEVKWSEAELTIQCQQEDIVKGPLSYAICSETTTWTLEPGRLEVRLVKKNPNQRWQDVVPGNKGGEEKFDSAMVQDVHSRLSHLCVDEEVQETGESYAPTFNLDQLEECDTILEDSSNLYRLDANSHSISHQISLIGHQWLMSITQDPNDPPCMCVRHDVDGCIWQLSVPESEDWPCNHIATFSALGYVAASKQQKKFILAAPDLSYAVICEASNYVFLYYPSCAVNGELRNRKTSSSFTTVAKQQLINLGSVSRVLGACATVNCLFIVTEDTLYMYCTKPEQ